MLLRSYQRRFSSATTRIVVGLAACIVSAMLPSEVVASQATAVNKLPNAGVCEREGIVALGVKPVVVGQQLRPPKKVRDVAPKYPQQPEGTVGSGMWAGEVLIDTRGKVSKVWAIREVNFKPPFPAFNQAIVDAVGSWEFEPTTVASVAVPICITVTFNINWR
jgi:hypothetical protein